MSEQLTKDELNILLSIATASIHHLQRKVNQLNTKGKTETHAEVLKRNLAKIEDRQKLVDKLSRMIEIEKKGS